MSCLLLALAFLGQTSPTPPQQSTSPPAAKPATQPAQETLGPLQRVWLTDRQCWADGWQITGNSPYVGMWRVKTYYATQTTQQVQGYGDPYGFIAILNNLRAQHGLRGVGYDSNLSAWASQNNAAQCSRGLGHHVNPGCFQNSFWNTTSAWQTAIGWMNSPGHREAMLQPNVSVAGIAYGPGPYWTLNLR